MRRSIGVRSMSAAALLGAFAYAAIDSGAAATAADATGTIAGRVVFAGSPPPAKKVKVTKDNEKCGSEIVSEELVVSPDKGIQNAVVRVVGLQASASRSLKAATIDQKGCVFRPRVAVVSAGAPLEILNSDGVLHNFHTHGSKNPPINKAQPGFKKKMTETFKQAEIMKVTCDAHPWMTAWVVVTDHPYVAVTESRGTFKIADVPAGNHTLEVWHETLGKITRTVAVKPGEETRIDIELGQK